MKKTLFIHFSGFQKKGAVGGFWGKGTILGIGRILGRWDKNGDGGF